VTRAPRAVALRVSRAARRRGTVPHMGVLIIGTDRVDLDAVLSEEYSRGGEVVAHPVQRGADLADHLRAGPLELRLQFVISNTPTRAPSFALGDAEVSTAGGLAFSGATFDRVASVRERVERAQLGAEPCAYEGRFGLLSDLLVASASVPIDSPRSGATFTVLLRQVRVAEAELVEVAPREPSGARRRDRGKQPARELPEQERSSFLFNVFND
jgi:hypothetical protein